MKDGALRPLTKSAFIEGLTKVVHAAGLDPLQGHGIQISSTLEYLLQSTPLEAVKLKGRWQSDAFHVYLHRHAQIMAIYMQGSSAIHEAFI
ncbi:hypothetical protein C8J56DRAFT_777793 [Mycena floridula]|nr:hypothetical protein C8J56DRAFT_777793 [Mycena floridula]